MYTVPSSLDARRANTRRSSATRITIAHRLGTIAACDKVLVLDKGSLKEYAAPSALLADSDSMFYAMCEAAGTRAALAESARKADARRAAAAKGGA